MGEWHFLRGLSLSFFIPKNDTVVNRKDFPRSYQESREDGKTFGEAFGEKTDCKTSSPVGRQSKRQNWTLRGSIPRPSACKADDLPLI
jgi:hypothetical protein